MSNKTKKQPDGSVIESNKLLDDLVKLVKAVETETYGGIYVCDVDETNWFDMRDEVLVRATSNACCQPERAE